MRTGKTFTAGDGVTIAYDETGEGRPIVFVHGWAATRRFWHGQIEQLSSRFRTIALDLRGHGDSGMELGIEYTIDRMSNDLRDLIDILDLQDYVLVRHSMGGAIAARCAATREGCAGLVLTGLPLKAQGRLPVALLSFLMRFRALAEKVVTPRMFGPDASNDLPDFVKSESARSPADVLVSVVRQTSGAGVSPDVGNLNIPILVIAGEFDSIVPPREQKLLAEKLGGRFAVLLGAGHNLMLEKPNEFNQILDTFASG